MSFQWMQYLYSLYYPIRATAFFAFAATAAYAADLFFRFQEWRSDGGALPWKNTQNSNQQNVGDGPKTVEV